MSAAYVDLWRGDLGGSDVYDPTSISHSGLAYILKPVYHYHYPTTDKVVSGLIMTLPVPGLTLLGGVARPIRWLNKIRKADDPAAAATASTYSTYKTAVAVGHVTGTLSVVGYYRDKYVQDALTKLIQGEEPDSVLRWLHEEHGIDHREGVSIILRLNESKEEFLHKSGTGGHMLTSRTGTRAKSFYDMDGISLLKSMSTPTPGTFEIGLPRGPRRNRQKAGSGKSDSHTPSGVRSRNARRRPGRTRRPWEYRSRKGIRRRR